jgi:CubicO group peptidase (beta-lactamase class C family)
MAKAEPIRVASILLAITACSGPQAIDARIDEVARTGGFRGALLVAKDGRILLRKAYGPADEAAAVPNRPETRFRIGSITKQFVAAAVLKLRDRGMLDLQDPVCIRVASCPAAWRPITLRHLLTHTSGLPDYTNFSDFPSLIGTRASTADLLARFRDLPLEFAPGDHWSYSNSGYVVLGAILETIEGRAWGDSLRDDLFVPLGMSSTGVDEDSPALPAHASGYLRPGVKPVFLAMSEFAAAGALVSTVDDLFVWDEALRTGKVLSRQSLAEATSAQVPCKPGGCALASDLGYGYGWFVAAVGGRPYAYHWGRIDGFVTTNGFDASDRTVVIALSNLETTPTFGMSASLQQLALEAP